MRDILTSPQVKMMKRMRNKKRMRLSLLFLTLFIVIVGACAYFSHHPRVTISRVVVSGTQVINASDIQNYAFEKMTGSYLYLFARSNSFIYPHRTLVEGLQKTFPRIETIALGRDDLQTLHITITERSGSYLYCGEVIPEKESDIGENCYYINTDGYIFDKAPYFSGNIYFSFYGARSGVSAQALGEHMLSPDVFHQILRTIDSIKDMGLIPISLVIAPDDTYTLYLEHAPAATHPYIVWKADADIDTILDNLSSSMNTKAFADEIKSKYDRLLYIDVRFKNKVLYKFNE